MSKIRLLSILLCAVLLTASLPLPSLALDYFDIPELGNGSETQLADGVVYTNFNITGGKYGLQQFNVVEVDMTKRNIYLELMTNYTVTSKKTTSNFMSVYNTEHKSEGKTMVAAVNGSLWTVGSQSTSEVATKLITAPRGVLMHDGEIYCSNETWLEGSENISNATTPAYEFFGFAVTDDYSSFIGMPQVNISLTNKTRSTTVAADGLNRLPVNNALMIYNDRFGTSNYALSDAYEVIVRKESGNYVNGGTIKGTVIGIANGGETALSADTIILSARGSRKSSITSYQTGDKIEIKLSITDTFRTQNTERWLHVKECVAGHMLAISDFEEGYLPSSDMYPSTMIGYANDGRVVLIQNDGRQSTWSQGLKIENMPSFCKELGLNTIINLDGGGSSTMVINGNVVNRPSDGSQRAVINAFGVVVGPDRGERGDMPIIIPEQFDPVNVIFDSDKLISKLTAVEQNHADAEYSSIENAAKLFVTQNTNDAYLGLSYKTAYSEPSADIYKAIVLKYKTSPSLNGKEFEVFLCAGDIGGPTGGYSKRFTMTGDNDWHYAIIDCSSLSWWTGQIHMLRLDFISGNSSAGDAVYLRSIQLAKTLDNAQKIAAGTMQGEDPMLPPSSGNVLESLGNFIVDNDINIMTVTAEKVFPGDIINEYKTRSQSVSVTTYKNSRYAGTGTKIMYKQKTYTVIVNGDADGNGKINVSDYICIKRFFLNTLSLSGVFLDAADTDGNGSIDSTDYLRIKSHLKKTSSVFG